MTIAEDEFDLKQIEVQVAKAETDEPLVEEADYFIVEAAYTSYGFEYVNGNATVLMCTQRALVNFIHAVQKQERDNAAKHANTSAG